MTESSKATILVVDQKRETDSALAHTLTREGIFEVILTHDWQHGSMQAKELKVDAVLCDGSMPWSDVLEFCRNIRSDHELASTVFIIIGPPQGIDEKVRGLEAGIDDWIEKSVPASLIVGKVKAWLRTREHYKESRKNCEILKEKRDVLQANFKELTTIIVKTLDTYMPGLNDRAKKAKAIAEHISEKLSLEEEEKKKIIVGALLHEIGKVGLPQAIAEKDYNKLTIAEREAYTHHAAIGSMIVSSITWFKDSAFAIYHQLENYDGSGIPDALMGDEISVGAKIIRAIVFQEELYRSGLSTEGIIENIKSSLNRALDPLIAEHLISFLEEHSESLQSSKTRLTVDELKEEMILAEDVYSSSGIKLLPKGVTLKEKMIKILSERNSVDPIIGGIYIVRE